MKFLFAIIFALAFVACKQNAFVKRHYMDGLYFERKHNVNTGSRTKGLNSKRSDQLKSQINESKIKEITNNEKCNDTLVLNGQTRIPCKVKKISQKHTSYTSCFKNDTSDHVIANELISEIHFYNGLREYITANSPDANPLLKTKIKNTTPITKASEHENRGLSIFGFIMLLISGIIILFSVPAIGVLFILLSFIGFYVLGLDEQKNKSFKVFYHLGRFFGFLSLAVAFGVLAIFLIVLLVLLLFGL